jgi:hypothetical protein
MPRKLKCETNTPEMGERIEAAFMVSHRECDQCEAVYEHGQWWIVAESPSDPDWPVRNFSVVDAAGPRTVDGFDFEEV